VGAHADNGGIEDIRGVTANIIIQQMLYLQYENKSQEIHMYINCPGGSVYSTLAIYDTMQFLECPIALIAWAWPPAAPRFCCCGHEGQRYACRTPKS